MCARVLEWAWSPVPFGHLRAVDGSEAIAIHGLALCQYEDSSQAYRFSCSSLWECEQDDAYESIEQAKDELPEQYRSVKALWQQSNPG